MSIQNPIKNFSCILIALTIATTSAELTALGRETKLEDEKMKAAEITETNEHLNSELGFSEVNARTLMLSAKQSMRHHNYKKAIVLLRKAVELDPDDPDVRCLYAEALQEKLSHQVDKDPYIFNLCVKNWLVVARNEVGDEKGASINGIGIGLGCFQDEDRTIRAKASLKKLTGYSPKPWETNDRYLRKVLKPATTSVTATIKEPEVSKQEEAKSKLQPD
jgi:tetratricopeptide (TPR) repeat protein